MLIRNIAILITVLVINLNIANLAFSQTSATKEQLAEYDESGTVFSKISPIEQRLVEYIDNHNIEAIRLLKKVVNINSGTMNFPGVRNNGEIFIKKFRELGMDARWIQGRSFNRAGHLIAKTKGSKEGKKLLLIGHLDTVFAKDSDFQRYKKISDDVASGPGISDMKGGNVIILQALSALKDAGLLNKINITVIMTGDEESPGEPMSLSRRELIEEGKKADIAIGFENGDGNPETAIISRRGYTKWDLYVKGNSAHSSTIFSEESGAGAIYEAARIVNLFRKKLSNEKYLAFNPGVIMGGNLVKYEESKSGGEAFGKRNVIAKEVVVKGDLRTISDEQLKKVKKEMENIVKKNLPHTSAEIIFEEKSSGFKATKNNYKLLQKYSRASEDLGFGEVAALDPRKAGGADISIVAPYVEMAIDGLGMGGENDHTVNEKGYLKTIPMQSKRAAILIYRLTNNL